MEKQELIIFTGNIGCGKSLLAAKLAQKGYVIVNGDSFTTAIHGGGYGLYDPAKKPIYHALEFAALRTALENGFSVVVDRTCMKVSDRKRYIDIGKEYGVYIHSYDWGSGNEKELNRRLANPNGIPESQWESVHRYMSESYESPSLDEGFNSKNSGPKDFTFYAFDFDGTIVENTFPEIGTEITHTANMMRGLGADLRNILIIWTCRSGNYLNEMRGFLLKSKIPFDFINENPLVNFGSPKIFAHEYFDDRNSKDKQVGKQK